MKTLPKHLLWSDSLLSNAHCTCFYFVAQLFLTGLCTFLDRDLTVRQLVWWQTNSFSSSAGEASWTWSCRITDGLVQCWGRKCVRFYTILAGYYFNSAYSGVPGGRAASALCDLGELLPLVGALDRFYLWKMKHCLSLQVGRLRMMSVQKEV